MSCGIYVKDLKKSYISAGYWKNTRIDAVRGVSFELGHGDVFGLIGLSGCGKSTIARILAGLIPADSGEAIVRGKLGFVSQDPYSSLSPVMRIEKIVAEPLVFNHKGLNASAREEKARKALAQVRLDYDVYAKRLPSQLSGGERQRIAIARALINDPGVLILDEPVSMLDYDSKQEILGILRDLSLNSNYAIMLISHDIGFVRELCTRTAVMDGGIIVEEGDTASLCESPMHELTKKLVRVSFNLKQYLE